MDPVAEREDRLALGEELFTEASDGWRLSLLAREPRPGPPQGVVVLSHAMMANRRSLDRPSGRGLASVLVEAGFATLALDARGHGRSGPSPAEGGDWTYDDVVMRDLPAALELARSRYPELPLAWLGHSLTAHGALALLGQRPELGSQLDALVSVSANVWLPELEPDCLRLVQKWLALAGFGLATWPLGYFPARRLGLGSEDVSRSFVGMFQVLRRSGRWCSRDGGIDYMAGLERVELPVLAVVGRGDRLLCHPDCSARFHRRLRRCRVWHWTAGRQTGLEFDPDHMQVLTDERSAPLWRAIASWLKERFAERGRPLEPGFLDQARQLV
jgi:predicted alpha/beta hydrolase